MARMLARFKRNRPRFVCESGGMHLEMVVAVGRWGLVVAIPWGVDDEHFLVVMATDYVGRVIERVEADYFGFFRWFCLGTLKQL